VNLTRDASMICTARRYLRDLVLLYVFLWFFSFRGQGDHPRSIEALRCQDICRYWPTLADVSQMVSRCPMIFQDFTTAFHPYAYFRYSRSLLCLSQG